LRRTSEKRGRVEGRERKRAPISTAQTIARTRMGLISCPSWYPARRRSGEAEDEEGEDEEERINSRSKGGEKEEFEKGRKKKGKGKKVNG